MVSRFLAGVEGQVDACEPGVHSTEIGVWLEGARRAPENKNIQVHVYLKFQNDGNYGSSDDVAMKLKVRTAQPFSGRVEK